jgi:hypothetical protein
VKLLVNSQTAILLIFFNRPDLVKISLKRLKESNRNIYISIDGPRNESDQPLVNECISLGETFAQEYSGIGAVKLLVHKSNLGCKEAVRGAIDWAFEVEERLIILEDDISFQDEFLETMDNWLEKFDDSKEIFHLNGYNPLPKNLEVDFTYLCRYTHVWGWATWRDRWAFYDRDLETWKGEDLRLLPGLIGQDLSDDFCEYWNRQLLACIEGLDTWDIQWLYSQWRYGGFSLTPGSRLTGNLGFDSRATHTKQSGGRSRERQPASHNGLFLNPKGPVLNLGLNLKHDSIEHGISGRYDFLKSPTLGIKTLLARTYLYLLNIRLFYQLTELLLRKFNTIFSHLERILLVFYRSRILSWKKPLRFFLKLRNAVWRILKQLIKIYKFLSWRILRK